MATKKKSRKKTSRSIPTKKTGKKASKKSPPKKKSAGKAVKKSPKKTAKKTGTPGFGTVAWLRESWIAFFKKHDHIHLPSSSLMPAGDPTLLFTTAGMVQFKSYFAGTEKPPHPRAATIQKCLRTTDLESVGKTSRHCTFFEMLGNFSFGDYFKEGAIRLSWDFSLEVLKLDPERIFVTVYQEDDEAESIWLNQIGVRPERISRLGKEDNWWGPAGDSGACGPCSELYLDRGEKHCTCGNSDCRPGDECERYMEYWNLVFNQFNQDKEGKLHPLPRTGIDTGAGLERIIALLNDQDSVYDTDEFSRIIRETEKIVSEAGQNGDLPYGEKTSAPYRVIADHSRSFCFTFADGIHPGNTGRSYVVKRIIRRALLYARELGLFEPFLYKLVPIISEIYGPYYPEIPGREKELEITLRAEEERFLRTLELGLGKWKEFLAEHKSRGAKVFSGDEAFRLYDTFGFPLEITMELAEKENIRVDTDRFDELMRRQQEGGGAGASWKNFELPANASLRADSTVFTGYDSLSGDARVLAIVQEEESRETLTEGSAVVILDRSCFYPEGGGQLGDSGRLTTTNGAVFHVLDARKSGEYIIHPGELIAGELKTGDVVAMEVDSARRDDLARHHSATHLLNKSLRDALGEHVMQTGSLVAPDYLRFDFSHPGKIDPDTLETVETGVNQAIAASARVESEILPLEEAKKRGAVATFGEKYGAEVRMISMGKDGKFSRELCGGTHAPDTGFIKYFHITRESSPGAGNRRIEAIAGERVAEFFQAEFQKCREDIQRFNEKALQALGADADESAKKELLLQMTPTNPHAVRDALEKSGASAIARMNREIRDIRAGLERQEKSLNKFLKSLSSGRSSELLASAEDALAGAEKCGEVNLVRMVFDRADAGALRSFGDALKERERNLVALLGARSARGPILLFMANKNATAAGVHCGELIREAARLIGGGGGGRPDMAQAGGKDADALEAALEKARDLIREKLA